MKPVWVLDTNVLVSAALTAGGTCDQVLRAAVGGHVTLAWSAPMMVEYRDVLLRPKFKFRPATVAALLSAFDPAHQVPAGKAPALPDPDDEIFLGTVHTRPSFDHRQHRALPRQTLPPRQGPHPRRRPPNPDADLDS